MCAKVECAKVECAKVESCKKNNKKYNIRYLFINGYNKVDEAY